MLFFSVSSRFLVRFWTVVLLMSLYCGAVFAAEPSLPERGGWFEMPLEASAEPRDGGDLYLVGGYNSIDAGTVPWGGIVESENLYVGDRAGEVVIVYEDGSRDEVPLVFGCTMWFRAHWLDGGAPFKTDRAEPEMTACLREALCLKDAFEGEPQCVLKIRLRNEPVREIFVRDNPDKRGEPVFTGGYLVPAGTRGTLSGGVPVRADDPFFDTHAIDSRRPDLRTDCLERIVRRLYTFGDDCRRVPPFVYPEEYALARIEFTGDSYANVLTRVFHDNVEDIVRNKMLPDGMICESSRGADSWRYDGFGTWVPRAESYTSCMYSRNRPLVLLSMLGLGAEALRTADFLNRWLMYYPEQELYFGEVAIPGHWSVIPNKPLEYSRVLVGVGWPTRYTKERFGEDFQNYGNAEPDGHGMTMMSVANAWLCGGASAAWVRDNWKYVREAVRWIDWTMAHPDLSFNEHGLMYGETEGGMMEFTMFNNMPCFLGLRMYAAMAEKAGRSIEAARWNALADSLGEAILRYCVRDGKWNTEKFGFFHDPSLTTWAEYVGWDVGSDVPERWYELSRDTYRDDLARYVGDTYMGPRGLGYDHNLISQNALLLDRSADYDRFLRNLARLCYAPRLPKPFIVPECASYSREKDMIRRQGDLGNFVQQNETLRTVMIAAGASKAADGVVKVMPRLPRGWNVHVSGLHVWGGDGATIDYRVDYPRGSRQRAVFRVTDRGDLRALKFRAGPFDCETVTVNGQKCPTELSGDARWAWVTIDALEDGREYTVDIR